MSLSETDRRTCDRLDASALDCAERAARIARGEEEGEGAEQALAFAQSAALLRDSAPFEIPPDPEHDREAP